MNNRLKQFLAAENITQSQFADKIEVVRASVSHVLSGRNNPSYEFIKAIMANYPTLNIEWLMFGKGKMYKETDKMQLSSATPDSPSINTSDAYEQVLHGRINNSIAMIGILYLMHNKEEVLKHFQTLQLVAAKHRLGFLRFLMVLHIFLQ